MANDPGAAIAYLIEKAFDHGEEWLNPSEENIARIFLDLVKRHANELSTQSTATENLQWTDF